MYMKDFNVVTIFGEKTIILFQTNTQIVINWQLPCMVNSSFSSMKDLVITCYFNGLTVPAAHNVSDTATMLICKGFNSLPRGID